MAKDTREFGIEFELATNFHTVAEILRKYIPKIYNGRKKYYIKRERYESCKPYHVKNWNLKTDSTAACELTSPILTEKDMPKVCEVLKALKENKVRSTNKESIHVHISIKGVNLKNVVIAWLTLEPILIKCFHPNRRGNSYCDRLFIKDKKRENDLLAYQYLDAIESAQDHHAILSHFHYNKRKTIEFRVCEGSLSPKLVINLLDLYFRIIDYAKRIDPFEALCLQPNQYIGILQTILELPDDKYKFWQQRYYRYNKKKVKSRSNRR